MAIDTYQLLNDLLKCRISKREFCKLGDIAAFLYMVGEPLLNDGQATVSRIVEKAKSELKDPEYKTDLIFSLFGDLRSNSAFTPGTAHYLFPRKMHPDDMIAGAVLEKVGSLGINNLKMVDNFIDLEDLGGTIVALGSPMSNYLSRSILTYDYVSDNPEDGMKRDKEKSFFELPFEYVMDSNRLRSSGAIAKRMLKGKTHTVPNWSIWSANNDMLHVPKVRDDCLLENDYLLITVLPNIFAKEAYEAGNRTIIIGGSHGVATKSIDLLFRDEDLLKILKDKSRASPYWQALFEIDQIVHDTKGGRLTPVSLSRNFMCSPIHCNVPKIERQFRA